MLTGKAVRLCRHKSTFYALMAECDVTDWRCAGVFRLQHEVNVLQQQLSESRRLVNALQCELQIYPRLRSTVHNDSRGKPYKHAMCILYNLDPDCSMMHSYLHAFRSRRAGAAVSHAHAGAADKGQAGSRWAPLISSKTPLSW